MPTYYVCTDVASVEYVLKVRVDYGQRQGLHRR
jgi:hypothetical protein